MKLHLNNILFKYFKLILILFISLPLLILFQNCSSPYELAINSSTHLNIPTASRASENGGGDTYDGKIVRFHFFENVEVLNTFVAPIGSESPYAISNNLLPEGLHFDPETGLIYGTPREIVTSPLVYQTSGFINGSKILQFIEITVGRVYYINSPISNIFDSDIDHTDNLCFTKDGYCSLTAAIEQTNANLVKSRIILPNFEIKLNSHSLIITKPVEIWGGDPSQTILNGENKVRIFDIFTDDFSLKDLQLLNGKVIDPINNEIYGSCLRQDITKLPSVIKELQNNSLALFSTKLPPSILSLNNVTISNCTIDAIPSDNGGALFFNGSQLTIKNSRFYNNKNNNGSGSNVGGAALHAKRGYIKIENTNFENNFSVYNGGAIYCQACGLDISSSVFRQNISEYGGSAIYLFSAGLKVESSDFVQNTSGTKDIFNNGLGGTIKYFMGSLNMFETEITNNLFLKNKSTVGSAIDFGFNEFGCFSEVNEYNFIFDNNKFVDNLDTIAKGGSIIIPKNCKLLFVNNIFKNNLPKNCSFESSINSQHPLGEVISKGQNIESSNSCNFTHSTDQSNVTSISIINKYNIDSGYFTTYAPKSL